MITFAVLAFVIALASMYSAVNATVVLCNYIHGE